MHDVLKHENAALAVIIGIRRDQPVREHSSKFNRFPLYAMVLWCDVVLDGVTNVLLLHSQSHFLYASRVRNDSKE